MSGSKTNHSERVTERMTALEALKNWSEPDYVWDGEDEDERPLTSAEIKQGQHLAKDMRIPTQMRVVKTDAS